MQQANGVELVVAEEFINNCHVAVVEVRKTVLTRGISMDSRQFSSLERCQKLIALRANYFWYRMA